MSQIFDAMLRAQRGRGEPDDERSLRDRLRGWVPRRRTVGGLETRKARELREAPVSPTAASIALTEELASLHVAVDALDDRISAEVVEREAKLLEEMRRGMRGLEIELSDRFVSAVLEMQRSARRSTALVIVFVALLAGLVVGVLSVR